MIRAFLFWLVWHVRLGRFAPWVMGLAIGRRPWRQPTQPKENPMPPERKEYELTQEQWQRLLDASKPVTYIVAGGRGPTSPQEKANAAWAALGRELGFDPMTVQSGGGDSRHFTAIPHGVVEE